MAECYTVPCSLFRSHLVTSIKERNSHKVMRVLNKGEADIGEEEMTQVLRNYVIGDTHLRNLKWEEITRDDVRFLKGIIKNKGKIKRAGNNRNKSKGFGLNRA